MQNLKKNLLAALEENNSDAVVLLAGRDKKVLSQLVRIAYDKETLAGWRAIRAIGLAARELVLTDYDYLREMVRKLLWSLSDESGGIGWSAPEIMGEIVSSNPARFQDIVPLIAEVYTIEERIFRPGVLYALVRIASVDPDVVMPHKDIVFHGLVDDNALARIYSLELLQKLKGNFTVLELAAAKDLVEKLRSDKAEAWVYKDSGFANVQVREAAASVHVVL